MNLSFRYDQTGIIDCFFLYLMGPFFLKKKINIHDPYGCEVIVYKILMPKKKFF